MRCIPGDLAVVINDHEYPNNNGALLRVVQNAKSVFPNTHFDWLCEPLSTFRFQETISPGMLRRGMSCVVVYRDCELRPLRDGDGQDETLSWLTKPQELQPA